jgi:hypothetical protein
MAALMEQVIALVQIVDSLDKRVIDMNERLVAINGESQVEMDMKQLMNLKSEFN